MGASLTKQPRVKDEGPWVVNFFYLGRILTVPKETASANSVPAAAVRQRMQALSGMIGRKAFVGGLPSLLSNPSAQRWTGTRNSEA